MYNFWKFGFDGNFEGFALATKILELILNQKRRDRWSCQIQESKMHNVSLDAITIDIDQPEIVKRLIKGILNRDPDTKNKLQDFQSLTKQRR